MKKFIIVLIFLFSAHNSMCCDALRFRLNLFRFGPDATNHDGQRLIVQAVKDGNVKQIKVLIARNADLHVTDRNGMKPFDIALLRAVQKCFVGNALNCHYKENVLPLLIRARAESFCPILQNLLENNNLSSENGIRGLTQLVHSFGYNSVAKKHSEHATDQVFERLEDSSMYWGHQTQHEMLQADITRSFFPQQITCNLRDQVTWPILK